MNKPMPSTRFADLSPEEKKKWRQANIARAREIRREKLAQGILKSWKNRNVLLKEQAEKELRDYFMSKLAPDFGKLVDKVKACASKSHKFGDVNLRAAIYLINQLIGTPREFKEILNTEEGLTETRNLFRSWLGIKDTNQVNANKPNDKGDSQGNIQG